MERVKFLNVKIDNCSMDEALEYACTLVEKKQNAFVVTPNVDHLVLLEKNEPLRKAYDQADLILADGMPIIWFSKLFKTPIKEKISGSDFLPKLCAVAAKKQYKMFFLGAAKGVAELAAKKLMACYSGLQVVGCYSPSIGFEKKEEEMEMIDSLLKEAKPDILVVALGCPKQEILICENRNRWNIPLSLGVGASLDFVAGCVKRAPKWMSRMGMEWFYRVLQEPRRMFGRYFIRDSRFIALLWKYRKQK
ncbi:MAG: WecB/TagA/CpsF family glycosyltransferase [Fibrobacter sp.]|nr:WecB/TagA/CpsF family glycosyltransferase [Fibrobacter sp.]